MADAKHTAPTHQMLGRISGSRHARIICEPKMFFLWCIVVFVGAWLLSSMVGTLVDTLRAPHHELRLDTVIPSDPSLLNDAVSEITAALFRTGGWADAESDVETIDLVLREAVVNAIVHGNHCEPEKTVRISVVVNENYDLLVSVKDSGSGFDPSRLPNPIAAENLLAPNGRGIFLIRQLMDEVEFRFDHGTEIRMRRRRQNPQA
jgi:serine/threonine-protein kinase RsbW